MEFLRSLLRRRFARAQVATSRNVAKRRLFSQATRKETIWCWLSTGLVYTETNIQLSVGEILFTLASVNNFSCF